MFKGVVERVPVPERKRGKGVYVLILIIVLIAAAALIYLYYPYSPTVQGPEENQTHTGGNQTYTEEQIELTMSNNYPDMRGLLLSGVEALTTCLASIENNVSVCNILKGEDEKKSCRWVYNIILSAQNRCEDLEAIKDSPLDFGALCEKLNLLSCDGLTGNTELFCRFILERDTNLCINTPGISYFCAEGLLDLYYSLKGKDCNSMKGPYSLILCNSLLAGNCSESIDKTTRDWVYAHLSIDMGNTTVCNRVNYEFIRNFCLDGVKFKESFEYLD